MGFFTPGAKIGVLYGTTAIEQRAYKNHLIPTLTRLGLAVTTSVGVDSGTADYSPVVLKMRGADVDHMLYFGAASGILFMLAAQNQAYYPIHGLYSRQAPVLLESAVSSREQQGAMSVGWQPLSDVAPSRWPTMPKGYARCHAIMKAASIDDQSPLSGYSAQLTCANAFFLNDALHRSRAFLPHAFRLAAESFGSTHPSVSTFGERLDDHHHDGVGYYRTSLYVDSCSCYQYFGAIKPLMSVL